MKSRLLGAVCACAITFGFSTSIFAATVVLFDQPVDANRGVVSSDINEDGQGQVIADQFTLSSTSNITQVTWYGGYNPNTGNPKPPTDFRIQLFDDSGVPQNPPAYEQVVSVLGIDTGLSSFFGDIFSYTANIDVTVEGLTNNWISIVEADINTPPSTDRWFWQASNIGVFAVGSLGADWHLEDDPSQNRGDMAFTLIGNPVPVPPAFYLFGSGLIGFVGVARRKAA